MVSLAGGELRTIWAHKKSPAFVRRPGQMIPQASLRGGGVEDTRRCHQLVTPRWSLESDITRPPPFSVVSRVSQSVQQCPLLLVAETPLVLRQHEQHFHTDDFDRCRNPNFQRLLRFIIRTRPMN